MENQEINDNNNLNQDNEENKNNKNEKRESVITIDKRDSIVNGEKNND